MLAAVVGMTGCQRTLFHDAGKLTSDGAGTLDAFDERPRGCTRQPWDGLPVGQTHSVMTLLWEDNNTHGFAPTDVSRLRYADRPLRMDVGRSPDGTQLVGMLNTVKLEGMGFDEKTCRVFRLATHEEQRAYPEGKPTLAGTLELDCTVRGSRLSGRVTFERCEY